MTQEKCEIGGLNAGSLTHLYQHSVKLLSNAVVHVLFEILVQVFKHEIQLVLLVNDVLQARETEGSKF